MSQAGSSVYSRFIFKNKDRFNFSNFFPSNPPPHLPQSCLNLPPYRTKSILSVCCVRVMSLEGEKNDEIRKGKTKKNETKQNKK